MALTHINFIKGLVMKPFTDGATMAIGADIKTLTNITFCAGTIATPDGDKMIVIIQMDLRSGHGQPVETAYVSVPATKFGELADLFRQKADQLARNTTPTAPLQ